MGESGKRGRLGGGPSRSTETWAEPTMALQQSECPPLWVTWSPGGGGLEKGTGPLELRGSPNRGVCAERFGQHFRARTARKAAGPSADTYFFDFLILPNLKC